MNLVRSRVGLILILLLVAIATSHADEIVHDAEFYILEAQNGEKWAKDDKALDQKLADFAKKNGGKPGIDGVTFADIEKSGVEAFLEQIQNELVSGT